MDGAGQMAPMAAELVDRLAILVAVRRSPGLGAADSCSLRSDSYISIQHFVHRSTSVIFRRFLGMCGENSCYVFMLFFTVLWVPVFETLWKRAVLML
jgi:hypothetical protein